MIHLKMYLIIKPMFYIVLFNTKPCTKVLERLEVVDRSFRRFRLIICVV